MRNTQIMHLSQHCKSKCYYSHVDCREQKGKHRQMYLLNGHCDADNAQAGIDKCCNNKRM